MIQKTFLYLFSGLVPFAFISVASAVPVAPGLEDTPLGRIDIACYDDKKMCVEYIHIGKGGYIQKDLPLRTLRKSKVSSSTGNVSYYEDLEVTHMAFEYNGTRPVAYVVCTKYNTNGCAEEMLIKEGVVYKLIDDDLDREIYCNYSSCTKLVSVPQNYSSNFVSGHMPITAERQTPVVLPPLFIGRVPGGGDGGGMGPLFPHHGT